MVSRWTSRKSSGRRLKRAISIRQPYAEQILLGVKTEEYRSVPTKIRERVYIYASLGPGDSVDFRKMKAEPGDFPTGVLVGTVEIVNCKWDSRRGCFAYGLERPRRLVRPLRSPKRPQPVWWRPF